jgi:negative regulator of flagellin synthesis FlgM
MKIESSNTAIELNAYLKQVTQQKRADAAQHEASRSGQVGEADKVDLSDRAREVQQAMQALKAMPEVRGEMVAQVKTDVDRGTYKADSAKTATGILRESFENNAILQKIDMRV